MNEVKHNWQTKARGTNNEEYKIYCECAGDAKGKDITTGDPLLTFEEWMAR